MAAIKNFRHLAVVVLALPVAAFAQSGIAVVSTADYGPIVAPGSIAAIFGNNLANTHTAATLDSNGNLPTSLQGTSVSVNGEPAPLFYVSPGQVNFAIPADIAVGTANISVTSPVQGGITGTAQVQLSAPGIYTIACLRTDRGAVENAITAGLEPFQATTQQNPGSDKRTRLSIYGTGFRFADNPARNSSIPSTSHVTGTITDSGGNVTALTVEYAGRQGTFIGLDQINVVLPASSDGLGLVTLQLSVDGAAARPVTIILAPATTATSQTGSLAIATVAGNGTPGSSGDNGLAVLAQLRNPNGVVFDAKHNLYIADSDNHVVRMISAAGVISTFAGTGTSGFSGDNGPAASAQLRRPVSLAFDPMGNLYVADAADNRIRRISTSGIITTVAGNGSASFSGDGGPAISAGLNGPGGVALNSSATLFIADTANNRVRQVTSDGLIATIAGNGVAAGNSQPSAYLAPLNGPTGVAADGSGNILVADSGNFIIRRIATNGSIATIAGAGVEGSTGTNCPASQALFNSPLNIASDGLGRLIISDTNNQLIRIIDANCNINNAVGNGTAGFSGDGGNVLQTELNSPEGITVDQIGNIYIADSANQRVRKLSVAGAPATLTFSPPSGTSGQTVTGYFDLGAPQTVPTPLQISSNPIVSGLPASITIPAGQTTGVFPFTTPNVTSPTPVTLTVTGPAGSTSGTMTVNPLPAGTSQPASLTFGPASIPAGQTITGTINLNMPAPGGGVTVSLASSSPAAKAASTVTVPAGQTSTQFLVSTDPAATPGAITITGSVPGATVSGSFNIAAPASAPVNTPVIAGVTLPSSTVVGGQSTTGTVTLASAAPAGGASVGLSSNTASVTVPSTITVAPGSLTATFPIDTLPVSTPVAASITATGSNVMTAPFTVTPAANTQATISGVSLTPATLTGGQSGTGTITLAAPAGANGASATVTSSIPSVSVPGTVTISPGSTSATFPVATSAVTAPSTGTITVTSANSLSTPVTVNPSSAATGTVASVAVNPSTITGGQNATGTVTLASPAGAGGVSIGLASSNPAVAVPATVTVPQGSTSATFPITTSAVTTSTSGNIAATSANSLNTPVTVNPSSAAAGTVASVAVNPSTITGGQNATGTVTLASPAGAGGVSIGLASSNPAVAVPATVTVPQGSTSATFPITTSAVTTSTSGNVTATSANTISVPVTVTPATPANVNPTSVTFSPNAVTGGQSATGTVGLASPAPAGGGTVQLSSSNGAVTVPASVTIPAGQSTATFTATTTPVSTSTVATITASSGGNSTSGTLTVNPPCPTFITAGLGTPSLDGTTPLTVNTMLNGPAPSAGTSVGLTSNGSSLGTINVPPGATSGSTNISVANGLQLLGGYVSTVTSGCPVVGGTIM